jgi:hypothetical protein
MFGHYLHIKSVGAFFGQGVHRRDQAGEMQFCGRRLVGAEFAVKVPKINASRQSAGALAFNVFSDVVFGRVQQPVAVFAFNIQRVGLFHGLSAAAAAAAFSRASSSALHDGAHTAWDLPRTLRVPISERARCLPHIKHDMVAAPKDVVAANGEPDTLDL